MGPTVDDLIAFLRDRLDEDEQLARRWLVNVGTGAINVTPAELPWERIYVKRDLDGLAEHIARHDPKRVLADVDAKRQIIDEHYPIDPCDAHDANLSTIPCDTLRLLALPYADHPDYREEWRP
jgi:hypothetical protein